MNKTCLLACLLTGAAFVMSCNNAQESKPVAATAGEKAALSVAYIEVDSLLTQYNFCVDYASILEQKSLRIQQTLQTKSQQLENDLVEFQKNLQDGTYTTQEQAETAQAALQKKQLQLQNLQQSLVTEFDKEQTMYSDALHDSLINFLNEYNKTYNYTYIVSKQGDNILLAAEKYNITEDVVKGLNKRYKPSAELSEELKKVESKK